MALQEGGVMKNIDISKVPNSVLIANAILKLYYELDDRNYKFRQEIFSAVTGKSEKKFEQLFYGEYFYCLDEVNVCEIAVNYIEYILRHDVTLRRDLLNKSLKTAKDSEEPNIQKIKRDEFLFFAFESGKKDFFENIQEAIDYFNNPKYSGIYISRRSLAGDPLAISDKALVWRFNGKNKVFYNEGKKEWENIDKRLAKLRQDLSLTTTNGV